MAKIGIRHRESRLLSFGISSKCLQARRRCWNQIKLDSKLPAWDKESRVQPLGCWWRKLSTNSLRRGWRSFFEILHEVTAETHALDSSESDWERPSAGEISDLERIVVDMEGYRSALRAAVANVTAPS